MYARNNKGPNAEPCGTPQVTCLVMVQWLSKKNILWSTFQKRTQPTISQSTYTIMVKFSQDDILIIGIKCFFKVNKNCTNKVVIIWILLKWGYTKGLPLKVFLLTSCFSRLITLSMLFYLFLDLHACSFIWCF